MKKYLILLILIILIAILFISGKKVDSPQGSIPFENLIVEQEFVKFNWEIPAGQNSELANLLKILVTDFTIPTSSPLKDLIESQVDTIISDSTACFDGTLEAGRCAYESTGKIIFNDGKFLVFERYVYADGGGAHPYLSDFTYLVIDVANKKILTENDIFIGDYKAVITPLLLANFPDKEAAGDMPIEYVNQFWSQETLTEYGVYIDQVVPNGNFYLNNSGVVWTFVYYEIGPRPLGNTKIFLSWETLKTAGVLNDRFTQYAETFAE